MPKEVLVAELPDERPTIEAWLSTLKGQRVRVLQPQRGARAEYMRLVRENAEQNLKAFLAHQEVQETAQARSLAELADALELPEPPHRIECYDVSNIGGTESGRLDGRLHRRAPEEERVPALQNSIRPRTERLRDDAGDAATPPALPAAGHRRQTRRSERELARKERFNKKPDLLLIDGGKGQLSAVVEVMEELDMTGLSVAGLAKEHEWLYLPDQPEPIVLPPDPAGAAPRHTHSRRSPSLCRHVSPAEAFEGHDALGARRARRCRPGSQEAAAHDLRVVAAIKRASLDEIVAVKGMTPALASRR